MATKGGRHCPGLIANCKAGFSSAGSNYDSASASDVRFLFYFFLLFVFLGFQVPLFSNIYDSYVSFEFDNQLETSVNPFNSLLAFHLSTVLDDFSYQNVYGTSAGTSSSSVPFLNHLPVAYPGVTYTTRDTPVFITLRADDQDGDPLTFFPSLLSTKTAHGKLGALTDYSTSSSLTTARIAYFPDRGYIGSDSFSYQAADTENAASNVATIYLIIR